MPRKKEKIEQPTTIKLESEKELNKSNIFNPEGELVCDVFETNSEFVVLTAIAGVQIKDLDIAVEKDMMIIRGQREILITTQRKNIFIRNAIGEHSQKK